MMYSSLFETSFSDSFFIPYSSVYVVSDSQLDDLNRNQHQEKLDNIEASRKRLEPNYQSRIKILDEREN